jgi:hypothetical protein
MNFYFFHEQQSPFSGLECHFRNDGALEAAAER